MRRLILPCALFAMACVPAVAATSLPAVPREQPSLHALADAPSQVELRMTITRLVGFGTRHTLSDTKSDTRGIGAARRWVKSRFERSEERRVGQEGRSRGLPSRSKQRV